MKNVIDFFITQNGYARMKELKAAGFHTRRIKEALEAGELIKVKPGLYRLASYHLSGKHPMEFIDVQKSLPNGVICLLSAAEHHQLSTINPTKIHVALHNKAKQTKIFTPPVEVFFFRDRMFEMGIETVQTPVGSFKVYNVEKTICDLFRYRTKLGEDIALECLKSYLNTSDVDLQKLWNYSMVCRIKTIIQPYIKAMVAV